MRRYPNWQTALVFGAPFLLGVFILAYWYWTLKVEHHVLLPSYGKVPVFSLTSEMRSNVTEDVFNRKVTIADFIFTQCAGTCPMMSTKMAGLQKDLGNDADIQFISFSVDPENDTPEVLAEYGKHYAAVQGKWMFLTGARKDIYRLTKGGFHLGLDIEGEDAIIHSQKFVLIDQTGVIRGYYDSEDEHALSALLNDARILQQHGV